jgi:hypothetical protein
MLLRITQRERPLLDVTISSQLGTLPTDFNPKFDPVCVYHYSGAIKYEYTKVEFADINSYATDTYVYALDIANSQIKTNQTTGISLSLQYTYRPADHPADNTEDSSVEPAPDITAMGYLAIAYWWLSSERNTETHDIFMKMYQQELSNLIRADQSTDPVRLYRPLRSYVSRGYVGSSYGS